MRFVNDSPGEMFWNGLPVQVARDESTYSIGIKIPNVSFASFTEVMTREIDTRPCDDFAPSDLHWGESDSLANIPRKTMPSWLRALNLKDDE